MGASLSVSKYCDNPAEEMRKQLLLLSKERFNEFRDAVQKDRGLIEKFRHATNNQEGDFFTNSYAAVGYMKNDVFNSKERTERVYRHVQDHFNKKSTEWDETISSDSGEDKNKEEGESDSEGDQKVAKPIKMVPQSQDQSTASLQAEIRILKDKINQSENENKLNKQVKDAYMSQDQNQQEKEIKSLKDYTVKLEGQLKEKDGEIKKCNEEIKKKEEERTQGIKQAQELQSNAQDSFRKEREKCQTQSKEIQELQFTVSERDGSIKSLQDDLSQTKANWANEIAQTKAKWASEIAQTKANWALEVSTLNNKWVLEVSTLNANWERDVAQKKAQWALDVSTLNNRWDKFHNEMKTRWEKFLEDEQNRTQKKGAQVQIVHEEIFTRLIQQRQLIRSQSSEILSLTGELKASQDLATQQKQRINSFDLLAQSLTSAWAKKQQINSSTYDSIAKQFIDLSQRQTASYFDSQEQINKLQKEYQALNGEYSNQKTLYSNRITLFSEMIKLTEREWRVSTVQNIQVMFNKLAGKSDPLCEQFFTLQKTQMTEVNQLRQSCAKATTENNNLRSQFTTENNNLRYQFTTENNNLRYQLETERKKYDKKKQAMDEIAKVINNLNIKWTQNNNFFKPTKSDEAYGQNWVIGQPYGVEEGKTFIDLQKMQMALINNLRAELEKIKTGNRTQYQVIKNFEDYIIEYEANKSSWKTTISTTIFGSDTKKDKLAYQTFLKKSETQFKESTDLCTNLLFNHYKQRLDQLILNITPVKENNQVTQKVMEDDEHIPDQAQKIVTPNIEKKAEMLTGLGAKKIVETILRQKQQVLQPQQPQADEESENVEEQFLSLPKVNPDATHLGPKNPVVDQRTNDSIQPKGQESAALLTVISQDYYRLKPGICYVEVKKTAQHASYFVEQKIRPLRKYSVVTFDIMGFNQDGFICFGELQGYYKLKRMNCQLGQSKVMIDSWQAPFLEEYVQLMEKGENIVFKCPYNILGKNIANKLRVKENSFFYFYIILQDAKETENLKASAAVEVKDEESKDRQGVNYVVNHQDQSNIVVLQGNVSLMQLSQPTPDQENIKAIQDEKLISNATKDTEILMDFEVIPDQGRNGFHSKIRQEQEESKDLNPTFQQDISEKQNNVQLNQNEKVDADEVQSHKKAESLKSQQSESEKTENTETHSSLPTETAPQHGSQTQENKLNQEEDIQPSVLQSKPQSEHTESEKDRIQSSKEVEMISKEEIPCDTLNSEIESGKVNEVQTFKQENEPEKQTKKEDEESKDDHEKVFKEECNPNVNHQKQTSPVADEIRHDKEMKESEQQPVVEFVVIDKTIKHLDTNSYFLNAMTIASFVVGQQIEKNTRKTKNYLEATFQILGFYSTGNIFFGKNNGIYRSLKQTNCRFGQNEVIMCGNEARFIEDYIQLMNKDEHIVFKCPYETLGEGLAKELGVKANSFVYFYIILKDAKETDNPKENTTVAKQEEESKSQKANHSEVQTQFSNLVVIRQDPSIGEPFQGHYGQVQQQVPNPGYGNRESVQNETKMTEFSFFHIGKKYQLQDAQLYANMNDIVKNVNANLKTETRVLVSYAEATYLILGFDDQGKILYGVQSEKHLGCYAIRKKTDPIGQGKLMMFGQKAQFIEDCIRSMEKGDAIVFKCPEASLNEIGIRGQPFAYFYIHLLATKTETETKLTKPSTTRAQATPNFSFKN